MVKMKNINKKTFLTITHDFTVLLLSFIFAIWLRLGNDEIILLVNFLDTKIWLYLVLFPISTIYLFKRFGLYQGMWKYASIQEIISIFKGLIISSLFLVAILFLTIRLEFIPRSFPILLFIVSILTISSPRLLYRVIKDKIKRNNSEIKKVPVIIVGEDDTTELFIRAANREKNSPFLVIAIIGTKKKSIGRSIHGIPIVENTDNIENLKKRIVSFKTPPQRIIITDHSLSNKVVEKLFVFSKSNGLAIGELPKISDLKTGSIETFRTNPIVIEDILGRAQRVHDTKKIQELKNKVILVTGAGGSIGSELCSQISSINPKKIILVEYSEYNLFKITQNLKSANCVPILADIRDSFKIEKIIKTEKPDLIFHTAALKHITFVETDPLEALKTNFESTVNIAKLCIKYNIARMVFISTDKAVNPTNIMGATKRLCEKYIQMIGKNSKTHFDIVRFGNVLGSTGSVVPLFQKQINEGGPITITHPEISRYFMTIREAVELVLLSSIEDKSKNGVIKILEMGAPVKIKDLAEKMIALSGKKSKDQIKINYTKLRPGEKLFEELFYENEIIDKTNIPGILQTKSHLKAIEETAVNKILKCIRDNNEKQSILLLKKIVPEYKVKLNE